MDVTLGYREWSGTRKEADEVNLNGSFRKSDAEIGVKPFSLHRRYRPDIISAWLLLLLLVAHSITFMLLTRSYVPSFCGWDEPDYSSSVNSSFFLILLCGVCLASRCSKPRLRP
jgi:hypothetical protein